MKIAGPLDVAIEDFEIVGGTAFVVGGSSIGVVVQGATRALFRRSHVAAGDAQPGANAIVDHTHAADGSAGDDGLASDCVPVDTQMFGSGAVNEACPAGAGGDGGGLQEYGEPGSPASVGGEGGELNTYAGACTEGGVGLESAHGEDGVGAYGLGVLDLDGWVAATAGDGTVGAVGGGGGGGGGGLPPAFTCTVSDVDLEFDILAPGGGGGGAGGCGGAGGRGSTGGGGAGGHAVGVAYRGAAPAIGFDVEFSLGVAGAGAGASTSRGDDGVSAETLAIE